MNINVIFFIVAALVVIPFVVFVLIDERRRRRHYKNREARRAKEADVRRAAAYHERWLQYGLDPDECEECHLPGDCPLCGA